MKIAQLDESYSDGYGWRDVPFINTNIKPKPVKIKQESRKKSQKDK